MTDELLPAEGSIILGPTDNDGIWELTFRDEKSGEDVRIVLPLEQLEEIDAEFTGLDHLF
ncbi:hypothetical protein [Halorussus marinus]|uniref:hypothetical protein n=1 Tax=Halorussus marinus TaxID=2505976 RepID=UPI00106E4A54|nr:hypothetical protein [Halorussus marinus]